MGSLNLLVFAVTKCIDFEVQNVKWVTEQMVF